ncbi:hypothetical protein [Tabrizicola oligotrophica]|uniref:Uncharacterized protein n=1 Tax=Tabrizicola oligotrophica TaxID=2710650 RepID=A0A6M0QNH3_9RHOB|nr:hypothetical protein [Tabrizicola oligotrophica]NEY88949.1 hypothetical protein [Tabrizicola oligotrophica]
MPVHTEVLPRFNLALFFYSGQVTFDEARGAVAAVSRHPDHHDTMRQLCDLSEVTGVERDFPELMKLQARMAEDLMSHRGERLVVFYAPTSAGQALAQMARKSWDGLDIVLVRVVEREDQALALLGLKHAAIAELFELGA